MNSDSKKVIPLTPIDDGISNNYKLNHYIIGSKMLINQSALFISGKQDEFLVIHYITKNSNSTFTDITLQAKGVATNGMNNNGNMYVYYWNATDNIDACLIVA